MNQKHQPNWWNIGLSGVQVYRKFYTEEKEKTNGVAAICVAKMAAQPYLSSARILSVS